MKYCKQRETDRGGSGRPGKTRRLDKTARRNMKIDKYSGRLQQPLSITDKTSQKISKYLELFLTLPISST